MDDIVENQVAETPVETPAQPQIDHKAVEAQAERIYQERNFKNMRDHLEAQAREIAELKRGQMKPPTAKAQISHIGDDDIVEGKHLTETQRYYEEKAREQDEKMRALEAKLTETSIISQCPDFYSVCTNDNLKRLRDEFPEIADSLSSSTNTQANAVAAYKLIKKLNINSDQTAADRELIQKNIAKPKPTNVIPTSDSDLTRANAFERGFSDAEKEARYRKMKEYANQ